jgi:hypothetical protein
MSNLMRCRRSFEHGSRRYLKGRDVIDSSLIPRGFEHNFGPLRDREGQRMANRTRYACLNDVEEPKQRQVLKGAALISRMVR